jgi:hypothetical protein
MPRPRKNDPTPLIRPLMADFARQISTEVERVTLERVRRALAGAVEQLGAKGLSRRGRRAAVLCYYPNCKNLAAPRFSMFCAALHKGLSASEKQKYRALHESSSNGKSNQS